jgi:hypothetical protein
VTETDPRTQPDEHEDATNQGASATEPAEGGADTPGGDDGSPASE